jgi:hypothetical protein
MIAHPLPAALIGIRAGEDVKAGFEPIRDSLRDLHCLMQLVFGAVDAIQDALAALEL